MPALQIGKVIQKLRDDRGMSTLVLARKSGMSVSGLCALMEGKHQPLVTSLDQIGKALDMDASRIVRYAERHRAKQIARLQEAHNGR